MKFARLTSRAVAGGATAALAAAALVGATGTPAQAAPVTTTTTYSCVSAFGTFPADVSVTFALLPNTAPAGFPVPAGAFGFDSTLKVSDTVASGFNSQGATGGKADDFGTAFGDSLANAPTAWGSPTSDGTNTTFTGRGANVAFQLPKAGTYAVTMPKQFTLQGTNASGQPVATAKATCSSAAPGLLVNLTLSKQASVTKLKAVKKIKHGAVETAKIKVTNDYSKSGGVVPTGKVTIKDGSKTIGKGKLKNGKVTIKVKALAVGTHNLVVKYAGDDYTSKSKSKKVKVTVTK